MRALLLGLTLVLSPLSAAAEPQPASQREVLRDLGDLALEAAFSMKLEDSTEWSPGAASLANGTLGDIIARTQRLDDPRARQIRDLAWKARNDPHATLERKYAALWQIVRISRRR